MTDGKASVSSEDLYFLVSRAFFSAFSVMTLVCRIYRKWIYLKSKLDIKATMTKYLRWMFFAVYSLFMV